MYVHIHQTCSKHGDHIVFLQAIFMIPTKPPPTLKQPENFSNEFSDFISRCLVKNPEERPSATNLSHHKFIKTAKPVSVLKNLVEMAMKMLEEEEEEQEDSVSWDAQLVTTLQS